MNRLFLPQEEPEIRKQAVFLALVKFRLFEAEDLSPETRLLILKRLMQDYFAFCAGRCPIHFLIN